MNAPLHREIPSPLLDTARLQADIDAQWQGDIVRQLTRYIAIPAKSPGFDADWQQHGY
ncbi:MAG TPA: peptidase M20, partial [Burkholderiaceae bacterium]